MFVGGEGYVHKVVLVGKERSRNTRLCLLGGGEGYEHKVVLLVLHVQSVSCTRRLIHV